MALIANSAEMVHSQRSAYSWLCSYSHVHMTPLRGSDAFSINELSIVEFIEIVAIRIYRNPRISQQTFDPLSSGRTLCILTVQS